MSRRLYTVLRVPTGSPVRVDRFLAQNLPGVSRRSIQRLLELGRIRVGGRRVRKGEALPGGAELDVEVAGGTTRSLSPEAEPPVSILYEDESVVALDKPPGRPAHALTPDDRGTVANFLAARYPQAANASPNPLEQGLVHRLDSDTSGVLLAAKNREHWHDLRRKFREREIEKRYLALVTGVVRSPGKIASPIAPDPRNRRRVRVAASPDSDPRARPALTRYRPLATYDGSTLLEVEMPTGVMHQIRAHLASIGHPVVGDSLYGRNGAPKATRQLLHAVSLAFDHPATGRRMRIESPLPADFSAALRELRARSPHQDRPARKRRP